MNITKEAFQKLLDTDGITMSYEARVGVIEALEKAFDDDFVECSHCGKYLTVEDAEDFNGEPFCDADCYSETVEDDINTWHEELSSDYRDSVL